MTASHSTATARTLVAIDVAKAKPDVLVELPGGGRKRMSVRNSRDEFQQLPAYLKSLDGICQIALEPTADYHRVPAYFLGTQGFQVRLGSTSVDTRDWNIVTLRGWQADRSRNSKHPCPHSPVFRFG